jgi:hypothetical protein
MTYSGQSIVPRMSQSAFLCEAIELSTFLLYTLLARNRLSRALARSRVTLRTLATDRQASSVTNASVTVYIAQPSNILSYLSAKLTSYDVIAVNNLSYPAKLIFTEFAGLCTLFDPGFLQDLSRRVFAYTGNIGQ